MAELTPDRQALLGRIAEMETENAQLIENLREALEHQTATAAVLEIIAGSPTDVQPVLEAIAENAARVCGANDANIRLLEGDELVVAATFGKLQSPNLRISLGGVQGPMPVDVALAGGPVRAAFLERRAVSVADAQSDEVRSEAQRVMAREAGYRAMLIVPLRRGNEPIGTIGVRRAEPGAFSDKQVQLLETFAAQAVIAIENVRLFTELRDSLEQQTAMGEVLEIIASSPTDVQPVLDAICASAASVCGATDVTIRLREGNEHRMRAHFGALELPWGNSNPIDQDTPTGRAILEARTVHVPNMSSRTEFPNWFASGSRGYESLVTAPLVREGAAIGSIVMMATEPNAFTPKQITLLETFAAQAVIAIENVRLFHELDQKTREQAETLEEQAATNHILQIISQSPTDVQPVLDAIVESAARICEVDDAYLRLREGDEVLLRAHVGPIEGGTPDSLPFSDLALQWQIANGTLHIPDLQVEERFPFTRTNLRDVRSLLLTPLMRNGWYVGGIALRRTEVRPFTDRQIKLIQTFAEQAVIAIENVRLFHELDERNAALREALEHQTATAEVLSIISRSPTDVQPVLDAICESAARVCGVEDVALRIVEGGMAVARAHFGPMSEIHNSIPVDSEGWVWVAQHGTLHIPDTREATEFPGFGPVAHRTHLIVPLKRQEQLVGGLICRHMEMKPFNDAQIKLLETFADQAVIALENVRLFDELQEKTREQAETLEEQTATNHILEIISQSPTDVRPVLDAICESAARVCGASDALLRLVEDGDLVISAHYGEIPTYDRPTAVSRETASGTAILDRRAVHTADAQVETTWQIPDIAREAGVRTVLHVPLLRDEMGLGVFTIRRTEVAPFTDRQVALLESFARQAVIATENVRLFHELEERNGALREALEHQTATAEVLAIISRSPTDVQPVLDAIVESAARVCGIDDISLSLVEGETSVPRAHFGPIPRGAGVQLTHGGAAYRAVRLGETVHFRDQQIEGSEQGRRLAREFGFHTNLMTPLRSEAGGIGFLMARRLEERPFTDAQIRLVQTFADQAVIAIENVRLFDELQQKTREQAETLEEQAATNHILEIISQSPTDVQPVLDAIVESAARLTGAPDVAIRLIEEENLVMAAWWGHPPPAEPVFPNNSSSISGRALSAGRTFYEPDRANPSPAADGLPLRAGTGSAVATPLMREGAAIGTIIMVDPDPNAFTPRQVALLATFADQAVIAIENVRLFHELEERNGALHEALEHQTATAEVLSIISRSPTDVQPVLDAICASAARVCGIDDVLLRIIEHDAAVARAHYGVLPVNTPEARLGPVQDWMVQRGTLHVPDVQQTPELEFGQQGNVVPFRTFLGVPLRRQGAIVGTLSCRRAEVRPFNETQIKLLETFADQAVIAIENVRLFDQLQARNRDLTESLAQQTATAEVLEVMSAAPEQLQVVLDAVAERATQVCNANDATIYIERDGVLHHAARWGQGVAAVDEIPLEASRMTGQAFTELRAIHVPDALASEYIALREAAEQAGARAYLAVPLIHEGRAQGVVVARRLEPEPFTERQIELLKTFADQGAIAITLSRLIEEIRDKNEQLEVASHHKSEFLANMSHELRTPLNAIIGFSEVLSDQIFGELNERQADYINDIVDSGKHLLSLINDILDLSKVEAGQMELELGLFSLPEALENGITMIRERAANHRIGLTLEIDPTLDEITADERKVKQVLFNLLSNAVKFTPDGGKVVVRAKLSAGATPHPTLSPAEGREGSRPSPVAMGEGRAFVEISVTDSGVGVAPQDQERIFEEFQQARDSATKATGEGTGLGLALARRFVELHGGRIWVESEVGKGSTFTFAIPMDATT